MLELTAAHNGFKIFLNKSQVVAIFEVPIRRELDTQPTNVPRTTRATVVMLGGTAFHVRETPDDIMEAMEVARLI